MSNERTRRDGISTGMPDTLHLICERDVGLFSLIQQVVAHIPWAMSEHRIPVAVFGNRCCYWTPEGYAGKDTVWEYYFEPVMPTHPADSVPAGVRAAIAGRYPDPFSVGYRLEDDTVVSSHFGDHPDLNGKTLPTPYLWDDPDEKLRKRAGVIIQDHVRPRAYLQEKVNAFYDRHMAGRYVIGAHVRGTDAASAKHETRAHRLGSLVLENYAKAIQRLLEREPEAKIFVATDAQASLDYLKGRFGGRVLAYESLRHQDGQQVAGNGPAGWTMPGYIAGDRARAARNGEEAVIEYLLLSRCQFLVHNGSGLARTVLLAAPSMPHINTHRKNRLVAHLQSGVLGAQQTLLRYAGKVARPRRERAR